MTASGRESFSGWLWPLALIAAATALLISNASTRRLRHEAAELRSATARLQVGDYVPVLFATSTDGRDVHFGAAAGPATYVVLLMTSQCPHCRATMPRWRALAERVAGDPALADASIIAFTSDPIETARAFADSMALPFPVVPFPDTRTLALFRGQLVPQTAVVRRDGRVTFVRHRSILELAAIDSIVLALRATHRGDAGQPEPRTP